VVPAEKKGDLKKNFNLLSDALTPRGGDILREDAAHGLYTRARPSSKPKSVAIGPTIAKAVKETGSLQVLPEHFMEKVRRARGECLYIIVLDSSSSMRMKKKIRLAKNLSWLLLKRSYEKKNRVALIVCRGEQAEIAVPPTKDVEHLERVLDHVPTGGKTPLTPALFKAGEIAARNSTVVSSVIVISDGRGNIFEHESFDGDLDALSSSLYNTHLVLINAENSHRSLGFLENMAERFGSPHFYLEEVL
jgi:magnesium chelatase subunit D